MVKYRKYGRVAGAFGGMAIRAALSKYMGRAAGKATARRLKFRRGRSYTKTRRGRRNDSTPLTNQYDYKIDYVKRRGTKAGYRRRRFSRRINNIVRNGMVGTTHILRRSTARLTTTENISNAVCYGLNGLNGVSSDDFNPTSDIGNILLEMDPASWAAIDSDSNETRNQRLYVHSCTMEMTIRNTGTTDAVIEAYFIRGRRLYNKSGADSPVGLYFQGFNNQAAAANPDNPTESSMGIPQLQASDIGVTPFQNQRFCQNYNIVKRMKFVIPPGGEISHVLQGPSGVFRTAYAKNGITDKKYYGVLYQQQGAPTQSTTGVPLLATGTDVNYLSVRRYRCKLLQNNLARDGFDASNPLR